MSSTEKTRLIFIDSLRGVAALLVVLYHAIEANHIPELQNVTPTWIVDIIEHGFIGVPIFFVISGFVIALSLDGKSMNYATIFRFIFRRSIRLDPPYWVAIVVSVGFGIISSIIVGERTNTYSLLQIFAHLLYMQDILGFSQINGVFWTLCIEFQFYIVFVILMALLPQERFVAIFGFISLLWPLGVIPAFWPGLFLAKWYAFLLGAAAYLSLQKKLPIIIFAAIATIVIISGSVRNDIFEIASSVTAIVILMVGVSGNLNRFLNWKWLSGLGAISYSLYLIHNPITGAVFRVGKMLGKHTVIGDAVWWSVSIFACIAAATLMWALIERPCVGFSRKIELA
jgi:peptidoglycan/LPS O-acetylase OafA/YrhL